jgi:hypothetical protein
VSCEDDTRCTNSIQDHFVDAEHQPTDLRSVFSVHWVHLAGSSCPQQVHVVGVAIVAVVAGVLGRELDVEGQ